MRSDNFKKGNSGLLNEYDRSMYGKTDSTSKGLIDKERTKYNYNLCSHKQYKPKEIEEIQTRIRGKKFAKNGNLFGTTIVTLPKDYEGNTEAFFRSAYKNLKKLYGLKEEDIVSAYVHMDETTPHMHFCFIPVKHLEDKDIVSWEKVMTKSMFNMQHSKLSKMMEEDLGESVNLLNGETLGIDVTKMTKENKILSMENEALKKELERTKEELITVEIAKQEVSIENDDLLKENAILREENKSLKDYIKGVIKPYISVLEGVYKRIEELSHIKIPNALKKANRVFGKHNMSFERALEDLEVRSIPEEHITKDIQEGTLEGKGLLEDMEEDIDDIEF